MKRCKTKSNHLGFISLVELRVPICVSSKMDFAGLHNRESKVDKRLNKSMSKVNEVFVHEQEHSTGVLRLSEALMLLHD